MAAARDETPILVKMFERWRDTVLTLRKSSAAISLLERPGGDEPEHLDLARREPARAAAGSAGRSTVAGVEAGADLVEECARGRERRLRAFLVAGLAERLSQERPRRRDLVGDLELLPPAPARPASVDRRFAAVVLGELHPAPRERGHGVQQRRVEVVGGRLELARRLARAPARSPAATAIWAAAGSSRARARRFGRLVGHAARR